MVMLTVTGKNRFRLWQDHALCFGDSSAVHSYNRIRTCIAMFLRVQFGLAIWSYYDDSPIVGRATLADFAWFIFAKLHDLLRIPFKGDPIRGDRKSREDQTYLPPSARNRFLGQQVAVGCLPCTVSPTGAWKASSLELMDEILSSGCFSLTDTASVFGKLRFLGSALHGRCGIPALQPIAARQHEKSSALTPAIRSSFRWLRTLINEAGPQAWPWGTTPASSISIFGDASEPSDGCRPRLGAVLVPQCPLAMRAFEMEVPHALILALPQRQKLIYFFELFWPLVAACIWQEQLAGQ